MRIAEFDVSAEYAGAPPALKMYEEAEPETPTFFLSYDAPESTRFRAHVAVRLGDVENLQEGKGAGGSWCMPNLLYRVAHCGSAWVILRRRAHMPVLWGPLCTPWQRPQTRAAADRGYGTT